MNSKHKKILKISTAIIRFEIRYGHLKWKVTEVARVTRTSRPRIYELFGSNKPNILMSALKILLEELYGLSKAHQDIVKTRGEFAGFVYSRELAMSTPEMLSFYFLHRNNLTDIGRIIREKEDSFLELVAQKNKISNPKLILFVRTIIHGISLAPFLSESETLQCIEMLSTVVQSSRKTPCESNT